MILLGAFLMRLHGIESMSLSNDEMSSLWRSYMHPSWHDMMAIGVMTDGHPPLTYIIMRCWLSIFGDAVWSIRLPFIIAGVVGLYYCYRTGVIWFGRTAALLAVSFLSMMSYSIYYHQIARPYSFGFLWVQAAAFYWTQFLFSNKVARRNFYMAGWVLMAAFSCYTHYFSFMAVALMGLTGLFFLKRENYRSYLLSGFTILVLLLPGLGIFKKQLSYNGLDWLPPPGHSWLRDYLAAAMNNSTLIYATMLLLLSVSLGWVLYTRKLALNKFRIIGICWFLISFLTGYLKSVYSMPVLQASCLIFTFPFLVLVFFSFWSDSIPVFIRVAGISLLLVICFYDTVYRSRYYSSEHHGEFQGLAVQMAMWTDQYSDMTRMTNVNNNYYWDYYWVKTMHRSEKLSLYAVDSDRDLRKMDSLLSASTTKYLTYAWSNKQTADTVFKVIQRYYPHQMEAPPHFNSGIRLYSR
jgi:uncharacterized membrane protein